MASRTPLGLTVAALVATLAVPLPAVADHPSATDHTVGGDAAVGTVTATDDADDAGARLLVTYDTPVDAEVVATDLGRFSTASVVSAGGDRGPSQVQVVDAADADAAASLADRLSRRDGVVAVEPDTHLYLDVDSNFTLAGVVTAATSLPPAWGIENTGRSIDGRAGMSGVDIGVTQAWPQASGRGVVVAVIDSGVDIHHPLLEGAIWRNPDERRDGRDTAGNGYVDDLHGWDFVTDSPQVSVADQQDLHGTHVAGVIAGQPHAETGFTGVAPDAKVMPLRFIDGQGAGWTSDAVRAVEYAVDNGADVINASWGGGEDSTALRTAIASAGVPVVASAGNTGRSHEHTPVYPGSYRLDNLISVAAVDHTGGLASFSATSQRSVDVAAPGTSILSAAPDRQLAVASGTSMATPFVAGALALTMEAAPRRSTTEVVDALKRGVRPLAGAEETVTGGLARVGGALAAAGASVPICPSTPTSAFADVPAGHIHHRGVACLSTLEVTSGISSERYGAEQDLRRDQVASLVANALEQAGVLPSAPRSGTFEDLDGSVHRDSIEALAAIGVVDGTTRTRFEPRAVVSRGEFAGIVARAADHAAGAKTRTVAPAFSDVAGSPYRDGIASASALSLVSGRGDGTFDPDGDVRRDQAASMLVRLLDRLHQQGMLDAS